jgi:hypothetical protein
MFNMAFFRPTKADDILRILSATVVGMGLTTGLRWFYRRIDVRGISLSGLAWRVGLGACAAAPLWYLLARFVWISLSKGPDAYAAWLGSGPILRLLYPMFMDSVVFATWGALYFSVKLWADWNGQLLTSEEAQRTAQTSQFQALRYQLNPHFLFNALNAVRALIAEDRAKAKHMITELSEFLRYSLMSRDRPVVPLAREIEAVERYLAIERIRYERKLVVDVNVEPAAADFPVVGFLVHPLVENAVRHGMRTSAMPLRVSVSARVRGERLEVVVLNSGRWVAPSEGVKACGNGHAHANGNSNGNGSRLDCIRKILESLYPGSHRLEQTEEKGFVRLELDLEKRLDIRHEETLQGVGS